MVELRGRRLVGWLGVRSFPVLKVVLVVVT